MEKIRFVTNTGYRLLYLNLLWLLFTAAGLLVGGVFPSTVALFAVTKKWVIDREEITVFDAYRRIFGLHLIRANLWGYANLLLGSVLVAELVFLRSRREAWAPLLVLGSGVVFCLFALFVITALPVYTESGQHHHHLVRRVVAIVLARPFRALLTLMVSAGWASVLTFFPSLIPVLGVSCTALFQLWMVKPRQIRPPISIPRQNQVQS
jgi:uncharacterized membrane protein YesL